MSLDVKTAFLLAPRRDASQRLLITQPPKVLIEAGVCKQGEIWEVKNSLYGLQEAPINWAIFRDEEMAQFRWTDKGVGWRLARTQEPNLWKVVLDAVEEVNMPDKVYAGRHFDHSRGHCDSSHSSTISGTVEINALLLNG